MRYSIVRYVFICLGVTLLAGCANQRNIQLTENFWKNQKQKIAVASFKAPEPQVHQIGGQGVLDLAVNSVMNKNMNNTLKRTDLNWYNDIPSDFVHQLREHHINAMAYAKQLYNDKKSTEVVLTQIEGDKLLTFELRALGARREYYGFIPTGAPQAYCVLIGKLIDPTDKKVLWRHEAEIIQPVQGVWDQSPNYPNFTNALHLAINEARQ